MSISAIAAASSSAATQQNTSSSASSPEMNGLGEDAFLMLLMAQLQHQDPLKPADDTEFISQLAQFNSLSELTKMNETLSKLVTSQRLTEGSALIGKVVSGLSAGGELITGVVQRLYLTDNGVTLDVDGKTIPLDMVHTVQAPEPETEPEPGVESASNTGL